MNIGKLLDSHLFAFVTTAILHNALCNITVHKDVTHESTPHMINPQLFDTSAGVLKYPQANRYELHKRYINHYVICIRVHPPSYQAVLEHRAQ